MKRRKSAKRKRYTSIISVISVILLSVTFAAFLVGILAWKVQDLKKEPIYETVSMSEEAAARAYIWLSRIEDMPFSYTEIRQIMGDIYLTLVLSPTKEQGRYTCVLAEGTVADCQNRAQAGLEEAYRQVVRYRLLGEDCEEELSDKELDELMVEAYGVSVSEYLASCEIQLLPTMEELTEAYTGEVAHE